MKFPITFLCLLILVCFARTDSLTACPPASAFGYSQQTQFQAPACQHQAFGFSQQGYSQTQFDPSLQQKLFMQQQYQEYLKSLQQAQPPCPKSFGFGQSYNQTAFVAMPPPVNYGSFGYGTGFNGINFNFQAYLNRQRFNSHGFFGGGFHPFGHHKEVFKHKGH